MRTDLKKIRRARAKEGVLGAWHSPKMENMGGLVEYRRVDGKTIFITEVGRSLDHPFGKWDDYKYLGTVTRSRFVRRISFGVMGPLLSPVKC